MKVRVDLRASLSGHHEYAVYRAGQWHYLGMCDGPAFVGAMVEVEDEYDQPVSADEHEVASVDESAWK